MLLNVQQQKAISLKTVLSGLALQFALAVFILTVPLGQKIISGIAKCIEKILHFANPGGDFVFGFLKSGAEALSNIASAFYIDQYSGHKKIFSLFSKIITGEDKTFVQYRQTVPDLIKADLNLDNNEYIELFNMFKSKKSKINAFAAKVNSLDEIPEDFLNFAHEYNLPIYIFGN